MILAEIRMRKFMTQTELSELTGLSQTQLSKIESGYVFPFQSTRSKIEDALGQQVDWIKTRMQKPFTMGSMDMESAEDMICREISNYIKMGQVIERPERCKFLHQFLKQFEKQLTK